MSEAMRAVDAMRQKLDQRARTPRPLLEALTERERKTVALRQLPLRLHPAVHAALVELSAAKGMSINSLLHAAIDQMLVAHGRRSVSELDPGVLARLR